MKSMGKKPYDLEEYYTAGQWQLMFRKFKKHRLANIGAVILIILYVVAMFCEFFSPYTTVSRHENYLYAPPQRIHFIDAEGRFHLQPFVYNIVGTMNLETLQTEYTEDTSTVYPLRLFVRGDEYRLWGLFPSKLHFFGVQEGVFFPFGTDVLGRDVMSRTISSARISLSIGLAGVLISFILGCTIGSLSGYLGGSLDNIIQRVIEFLISVPTIPLWLALSAALPVNWPPTKVYFGITIILSLVGWAGLARVVRGKLMQLREEDFVMAARFAGASTGRIIASHLLPSFLSYLIVHLTLAIPGMILGETALSFLGLGMRPPAVSWGVMLQDAQNVYTIALYPWLLTPGLFVILTVFAFNFVGDGLRDAADPYR
jgi:peptide/nickel transport system permease protein